MYEAYTLESVLQNLPHTFSIECAALYKNTLLLGTKQGQLVIFHITLTGKSESPLDVKFSKTIKGFSLKPVTQLVVVEDHNLLFSLSDQTLRVHIISETFPKLEEFLGVTAFACGTQIVQRLNDGLDSVDEDQQNYTMVRLCVALRRKVQLYYWSHSTRSFVHHPYEHILPDTPRVMHWSSEEYLVIGFRTGYIRLKANRSGAVEELFNFSRQCEPLIAKLDEHRFTMWAENKLCFFNSNGKPTMRAGLDLNKAPVSVAYDHPYLTVLSPAGLEVRTIDSFLTIQDISISQTPKPLSLIVWKKGMVFVASSNNVWCLVRTSVENQLQICKSRKLFDLALELVQLLEVSEDEKKQIRDRIGNLHAFDLFIHGKFDKALKLFEKIGTDPVHVIGLFPSLLKDQHRSTLQYPEPIPTWTENRADAAMKDLIVFLSDAGRSIRNQTGDSVRVTFIKEGGAVRSKRQLIQIIDTTLLKLYNRLQPGLLLAFLKFPNNLCHLEESEAILIEHKRFAELILLYEQKGAHRKALQLLAEQAPLSSSPLYGHDRTVDYLQRLSGEHFDLILEYAKWVIDAFPDDGLKIFTGSRCGRDSLPRHKVVRFLDKESRALVLNYLEHIILAWQDETIEFHNMLIHKYREQILRLADGGELNDPEVTPFREKLIRFLRTSTHYQYSKFPQYFLNDKLYVECAIVMGKLNRHQDALALYVHVLRDLDLAEEYCIEHYRADKVYERDLFVILLRLYISPADICLKALAISAPPTSDASPDIQNVLDVLERHTDKLDALRVIEVLPPDVPLHKLMDFLRELLKKQSAELSKVRLHSAFLLNRNLKTKLLRLDLVRAPVTIGELRMCDICNRRINRSVFVQTENGEIVHYACHNERVSHGSTGVDTGSDNED